MRPKAIVLSFGEEEFKLLPLTLRQLQELEEYVAENAGRQMPNRFASGVFKIALSEDFPDVQVEKLRRPDEGASEMAIRILKFAGFQTEGGEDKPGEAQAEPAATITGG